MFSRVTSLLAPLLALLALAGCSGDGDDARGTLSEIRPIQSADASVRLRLELDNAPPEASGPIELTMRGPLRSNGPDRLPGLDWNVAFSGFGERFASRVVSTGDNAFVRLGGVDFEVGEQRVAEASAQAARTSQQNPQGLASLGIDPLDSVRTVEEGGTETVGGTETTAYTGTLDLAKLLVDANRLIGSVPAPPGQAAPLELTPEVRRRVTSAYEEPRFRVNVAEDDTLRRFSVDTRFRVPPEQQAQAGGATGGKLSYSVEYTGVNGRQTITPPTGARPLEEFQRELERLLGERSRR